MSVFSLSTFSLSTLVAVGAALWVWPAPGWALHRVVGDPVSVMGEHDSAHPRPGPDDPFAVAASFDLFAVCLRAGMPIAAAAGVVSRSAPPGLARPLASAAELLGLGADPEHAWRRQRPPAAEGRRPTGKEVDADRFEALATLARRSARSGSSLSGGLTELADSTRREAHDDALAAAERAGVAISGPLGLCFLPAFVCLGIVPVVVGLAGSVLGG
ncbi:type II secretion system F family protein [Gordonia sp. DT218]|uniref:type II secretion system F family protein n=1 Tax=unclassified Gordonia (in: high G+C Gram-positive bacteria) TaxID=2657482 RepID=UPI003CEF1A51